MMKLHIFRDKEYPLTDNEISDNETSDETKMAPLKNILESEGFKVTVGY